MQQYGFAQLRQMIGIMPQRAVLFTGTIRDNMQWSRPDATDEQIWQALEIAQAADFCARQAQRGWMNRWRPPGALSAAASASA